MGINIKKMQSVFNGDKFTSKHGELEIIDYVNCNNVKVRFTNTGYQATTCTRSIMKGFVKDYLRPSIAGVGYLGKPNLTVDPISKKIYKVWKDMLQRCYQDGTNKSSNRYYGRNITVCDEWMNFENFLKWSIPIYREGFHLDKDILGRGKNIYSPDTAFYVPPYINLVLSGRNTKRGIYPIGVTKDLNDRYYRVIWTKRDQQIYKGGFKTPEDAFSFYKKAKEEHIKDVAQEYYDRGDIPRSVYEKLIQWEVVPFPD